MTAAPLIFVAMPAASFARFFPADLVGQLGELGEVVLSPTPDDYSSPAARALLARAEVIVSGWGSPLVDRTVLGDAPRLRAVVHSAGSVRSVADKACYDHGVVISSQAWANAIPVAEYTLAMILLSAKGAFRAQWLYRERRARFDVPTELIGYGAYARRVGIIGASTIGRRVIELLAGHDLELVVADPTLDVDRAAELGAELITLPELLRTSDVISLHAPLLPATVGMIGADHIALIRDGATFINTARGALVDQAAMINQLRTGRFDAVLDVSDPEVPGPDSLLWDMPNLILTPHVAGAAGTELYRLGASAVEEVGRVLRGEPLLHGISRDRYDTTA